MLNLIAAIIHNWRNTPANYITLGRLAAGLIGINYFYWVHWDPWLMLLAFAISSGTDKLDGIVARAFVNGISISGKLLDPLVDKVLGWTTAAVFGIICVLSGELYSWALLAACVPAFGLVGLYDWFTVKMRGLDDSVKTNPVAKKKQAYLFFALGCFLASIAFRDMAQGSEYRVMQYVLYYLPAVTQYLPMVQSWEYHDVLHFIHYLLDFVGYGLLVLAIRLLAESARVYLRETTSERALAWKNIPWIAWLLKTL